MAQVLHTAWREYEAARRAGNDASMMLLVATHLGAERVAAAKMIEGQSLPQAFPHIPHIGRVNVVAPRAQTLLAAAERHLAMMAIPYALTIQERFLADCVALLRKYGHDDRELTGMRYPWANPVPLKDLHGYVAERTGAQLELDDLALFAFLNRVRNRLIHARGEAKTLLIEYGKGLKDKTRSGHPKIRPAWETLTKRPLQSSHDHLLILGEPEIVAGWAICKRLAVPINASMAAALNATNWAGEIVEEVATLHPKAMREKPQRDRRVVGHARAHFDVLDLVEQDLLNEVQRQHP